MVREQAAPGEEIVLIDFSIALVKDPDETVHGLSRAAGTIDYMAPEQGIGYADESSDIYSLAKVLIEMLSGGAAFHLASRSLHRLVGAGPGTVGCAFLWLSAKVHPINCASLGISSAPASKRRQGIRYRNRARSGVIHRNTW